MIVRIVKLSLDPDYVDEFLKNFETVKDTIRNFEGCNHLELLGDINAAGVVFTYSKWENEEALQGYLDSPLFINIWKQVKPMFIAKAEAWSSESLSVAVVD